MRYSFTRSLFSDQLVFVYGHLKRKESFHEKNSSFCVFPFSIPYHPVGVHFIAFPEEASSYVIQDFVQSMYNTILKVYFGQLLFIRTVNSKGLIPY